MMPEFFILVILAIAIWASLIKQDGMDDDTKVIMLAAIKALEAHDLWHAAHDDHDGYPESELSEQSMQARKGLVTALATGRLS